jgi:hypothetical protein
MDSVINRYKNIKYVMYADDLQLIISCSLAEVDSSLLERESCIHDIRLWLCENSLVINDVKTEFIAFRMRSLLAKLPPISLKVGEVCINLSESVRNLGVIFDSELKFQKHATRTCQMCYAQLKLINRHRRCLDEETFRLLVDSLVFSRINYCASLFYGLTDNVLNKLERVVQAGVRWLERMKRSEDVKMTMKLSGILNVQQRTFLRLSLIMYNCLSTSLPTYLYDHLVFPASSSRELRSSTQELLFLPRTRTEIGKLAFGVAAVTTWNMIPISIRQTTPQDRF